MKDKEIVWDSEEKKIHTGRYCLPYMGQHFSNSQHVMLLCVSYPIDGRSFDEENEEIDDLLEEELGNIIVRIVSSQMSGGEQQKSCDNKSILVITHRCNSHCK